MLVTTADSEEFAAAYYTEHYSWLMIAVRSDDEVVESHSSYPVQVWYPYLNTVVHL